MARIKVSTARKCTCEVNYMEAYASATSDWQVMLVADMHLAITSEGVSARTNLVDKNCGAKETDSTRAFFYILQSIAVDPESRSADDLQQLLQHMQRTTSLLADRLANAASSAPPSASLPTSSVPLLSYHSSSSGPPFASGPSSSLPLLPYRSPSTAPPSTSQSTSVPSLPYHSLSSARPPASWPSSSACLSLNTHRDDDIQANLARLFRPNNLPSGGWRGISRKTKREVPWTHVFVCLPEPDAVAVPNPEEARFLEQCGIGKKMITFLNNMGDHAYLTEHLYKTYPPLREAGGYTLSKSDRTKRLSKVPIPASGYSIEYLRRFVDIKRAPLYIIPLQRSLTLCPPVEEKSAVMERCLRCDKDFPL